MSVKHDAVIAVSLTAAFAAAVTALFFSSLPSLPLFLTLVFIAVLSESFGVTSLAFILAASTSLIGVFFGKRLNHGDPLVLPLMLIVLWVALSLTHFYRSRMENRRWRNVLEGDEIEKEAKNLRQEITLYEQRQAELTHRTAQRRQLATAAKELGGLLDPTEIQSKLLSIAQSLFPSQTVHLSYGQYQDAVDSYVIQKRQPLVVPSDAMKGAPLIAAPISVQRNVVGILKVGRATGAYSRDDLRQLDILAGLASLAMDNCQLFQQAEQSAFRDHLTGLLTHRAFQDQLDSVLLEASRYNQSVSLILVDVDHFKSVNDSYGHQAGDQVLQGVAHILDRNVRNVDIIARYGGEEFAILLLQTPHRQACETAEKIRLDLADQGIEIPNGALSVTASFGVATYPEDATSSQQLFRQADQRLYKAKNSGRNQVRGLG